MAKAKLDQAWYAVMTAPSKEVVAARGLRRRGYAVCLPMRQERREYRRGKRRMVVRIGKVILPGYLFVRVSEEQGFYNVKETPCVSTLVYTGDESPPIPGEEITALREHIRSMGSPVVNPIQLYNPGEKIEFIDGPYIGYGGTVIVDTGTKIRISSPEINANPVIVSKRHYVGFRKDSRSVA